MSLPLPVSVNHGPKILFDTPTDKYGSPPIRISDHAISPYADGNVNLVSSHCPKSGPDFDNRAICAFADGSHDALFSPIVDDFGRVNRAIPTPLVHQSICAGSATDEECTDNKGDRVHTSHVFQLQTGKLRNQSQAGRAGNRFAAPLHSLPEDQPVPPSARFYWWTLAFLVSCLFWGVLAMLLFTPEVAEAAVTRLHDALFYVERV